MKKIIVVVLAVAMLLAAASCDKLFGGGTATEAPSSVTEVPSPATETPAAATDEPAQTDPTEAPDDGYLTTAEALGAFGGYWTAYTSYDEFIHIFEEDGELKLQCGNWSTRQISLSLSVKVKLNDVFWKNFTFSYSETEGTVEKEVLLYNAGQTFDIDLGGGSRAYLFDKEAAHDPAVMAAFVDSLKGSWTAEDNTFVHFSTENGKSYVLFAVWYSGGEFPVGEIVSVEQKGPFEYELGLVMKGETTVTKYSCKVDPTGTITLTPAYGSAVVYRYDPSMQLNAAG